jgi:hypothetical protein
MKTLLTGIIIGICAASIEGLILFDIHERIESTNVKIAKSEERLGVIEKVVQIIAINSK